MGRESRRDPVAEAAVALYGLPPDQFVLARADAAKTARDAGDLDAGKAIASLVKPNAVAAAANALVRAHRAKVDELVDLGEAMRVATARLNTEELRQLSTRQHRLIAALIDVARADSVGPFTVATARGLESTLRAGLADAGAARALLAGQLTRGLSPSGFPGMELEETAGPSRASLRVVRETAAGRERVAATPRRRSRPTALEEARQAEADACAALERATASASDAHADLDRAVESTSLAAAAVQRLEAELTDARIALKDAHNAELRAQREHDRAQRAVDRARSAQTSAAETVHRLGDRRGEGSAPRS